MTDLSAILRLAREAREAEERWRAAPGQGLVPSNSERAAAEARWALVAALTPALVERLCEVALAVENHECVVSLHGDPCRVCEAWARLREEVGRG